MVKWLASVQSVREAQALLPISPDILDIKDPTKGALGALNVDKVREIVSIIAGRCLTSATIGDLPMQASIISAAMTLMATSGVDYIKVAVFPDAQLSQCLHDLADSIKTLRIPVIAVIFADKPINMSYMPLLAQHGFYGVIVDTAIKNSGHLLNYWDINILTTFIATAQRHQLICGLAGALRADDIQALIPLGADYLGFRSALCWQNTRTESIDPAKAKYIASKF